MKIIHMPRGGGKTTRAIALCKKTGAVLVVTNAALKRWITRESSSEYTLPERQVVTLDEILEGPVDRLRGYRYPTEDGIPDLIIDDADSLIRRLISAGRVRWITMSKPLSKAQCRKRGIDWESQS